MQHCEWVGVKKEGNIWFESVHNSQWLRSFSDEFTMSYKLVRRVQCDGPFLLSPTLISLCLKSRAAKLVLISGSATTSSSSKWRRRKNHKRNSPPPLSTSPSILSRGSWWSSWKIALRCHIWLATCKFTHISIELRTVWVDDSMQQSWHILLANVSCYFIPLQTAYMVEGFVQRKLNT